MNIQIECLERELRHLQDGPSLDEKPAGLGTIRFVAHCDGDSWQVLAKAKDVLVKVDQAAMRGWPGDEAWSKLLPDWFVARCVPEMSQEEAEAELNRRNSLPAELKARTDEEAWSLLNWLYWFQPQNRKWFWWDAEERDANTIILAVEVDDWPLAWGSLKWLIRAAGAAGIAAEE